MPDRGWKRSFDDPITVPRGRQLITPQDAGAYITKLPKAEHEAPEWQAAMEAVILVAESDGPTMFARIGFMRGAKPPRRARFQPRSKGPPLGTPQAGARSIFWQAAGLGWADEGMQAIEVLLGTEVWPWIAHTLTFGVIAGGVLALGRIAFQKWRELPLIEHRVVNTIGVDGQVTEIAITVTVFNRSPGAMLRFEGLVIKKPTDGVLFGPQNGERGAVYYCGRDIVPCRLPRRGSHRRLGGRSFLIGRPAPRSTSGFGSAPNPHG
jgi:hypothetical protein